MTTTLVTGGLGFIGSHLVEELRARGDRVLALDEPSTGVVRSAPRPGFVDMSDRRPDLSRVRPLIGFISPARSGRYPRGRDRACAHGKAGRPGV